MSRLKRSCYVCHEPCVSFKHRFCEFPSARASTKLTYRSSKLRNMRLRRLNDVPVA